jgi:hypothetical protein
MSRIKGQDWLQSGKSWPDSTKQNKEVVMSLLADLWGFLKERKKWWLFPIIILLLIFGLLIVLSGGSAIAPFIYAIF